MQRGRSRGSRQTAVGVLGVICVFNLALGLLAELAGVALLQNLGIGWPSAVVGVVYAGLAYGTWKRSFAALLIGALLFLLDGLYTLWLGFEITGRVPMGGIVVRTLLLVPLFRALGPIRLLAREHTNKPVARFVRR